MSAAAGTRMRTYTAIITARGGSKGLPGKNLALLAGRPLIAHSIAAALGSTLVRRVVGLAAVFRSERGMRKNP